MVVRGVLASSDRFVGCHVVTESLRIDMSYHAIESITMAVAKLSARQCDESRMYLTL